MLLSKATKPLTQSSAQCLNSVQASLGARVLEVNLFVTWGLRNDVTARSFSRVCGGHLYRSPCLSIPQTGAGREHNESFIGDSLTVEKGQLSHLWRLHISDVDRATANPTRSALSNGQIFGTGQLASFWSSRDRIHEMWLPTTTLQMRTASSTATQPKRQSDVEENTATNAKEGQEPSAPPSEGPQESQPEDGKPSKTQQLKKVFKEYGAVGVSFHVAISLMSLGMCYLAVSSGIDMAAILYRLGFSETVVQSKLAAGTSTFVLSYAVHKLFAPVRISITLVSVPLIVRHFRKTGLFKPPASSP